MDSNMATRIVGMLNAKYGPRVSLPASAAHEHVNASAMAGAIVEQLSGGCSKSGDSSTKTKARNPAVGDEDSNVVIVGQAFRLPGNINDPEAFWSALLA